MNKKERKEFMKKSMQRHKVWHKFCRWGEKEFGKNWQDELSGYEAMEKIEAYAKKNKEISIAYCDDELFASSLIVVVPHKEMGNTVMFVPQLTNSKNNFFLYPNHQKSLIKALNDNTHIDPIMKKYLDSQTAAKAVTPKRKN